MILPINLDAVFVTFFLHTNKLSSASQNEYVINIENQFLFFTQRPDSALFVACTIMTITIPEVIKFHEQEMASIIQVKSI